MKPNVGISDKHRAMIADSLCEVLAGTYALQLQTQHAHWNVQGPLFDSLHKLFQTQYEEMQLAVDELAERIRVMGEVAPGTFSEFLKLSPVKQKTNFKNAQDFVEFLMNGHETMIGACKKSVKVCEKAADEATADLLTERIASHGKVSWMLRATLQD
jgi:starvation-inducible DNA-binding protein